MNPVEKSDLQQFIDLILLNIPNIVLIFDTDGKVVLASESYLSCGKHSSIDEIQGKSFSELFSAISTDSFLHKINDFFRAVSDKKTEYKIEQSLDFGQSGNLRTYDIHMSPLISTNDSVLGTILVFHDLTEILQAQYEAERAREIAEQSTRAKSEFLARMTHEMRTPMNAIIGMTSIGKAAPDVEKKNYSFQRIEDASSHLLGVINDVLDMSKIEAGKLELLHSNFNFERMLSHVNSIIGMRAQEKNQAFLTYIDSEIPANIISDEQRLAQVITNLLSNAIKFTPEFGIISFTAEKVDETEGTCTLRFVIKDNGIGISQEQQKHLFSPFEQADGSISRKYGGTGLGLAISKRIVENMGGTISLESELGKGSSFIFDIKAQRGSADLAQQDINEVFEKGLFYGKRILIAEDVDINREIISALLEESGIEIDFAVNGRDALEKYIEDAKSYSLILMDIQMPELDGYEATKQIRSSGQANAEHIPIIAMTANVFKEDIERCLKAGMNDHLGKPVEINIVMEKLKRYLL